MFAYIKKSTLLALLSFLVLSGCASHYQSASTSLTAEQKQNWDEAVKKYKACGKERQQQREAAAPQFGQLVHGFDDPKFFEKMTSPSPVTKEFKEALITFRPQQLACRQVLFDALGEINPAVKLMYIKNFKTNDDGIIKVLEGKVKTIGEVNQLVWTYNYETIERKYRLLSNYPLN